MNMKKVIGGVVCLVIGVLLLAVGYVNFESINVLADDYDGTNFGTYDVGDEIFIEGKITDEQSGIIYTYQLDDVDFDILSTQDLGGDGDTVKIMIEITDFGGSETPEVRAIARTPPIFYIGIILLIVGVLIAVLGVKAD